MAKLPKHHIRRNTVVIHRNGTFYGRVIRLLPDGTVFWLCTGLHFRISKAEDLEVGYKGYYAPCWNSATSQSEERFVPMTTLRRLKKRAQQFHYGFAHNTPLDYEFIRKDV